MKTTIIALLLLSSLAASAEVINLKLPRINNNPITKLEVVALIKSAIQGRILSVKRHSGGNPDCHYVKILRKDGEYILVKVSCQ